MLIQLVIVKRYYLQKVSLSFEFTNKYFILGGGDLEQKQSGKIL